ncbi:MAG: hypothetical protein SVU32_04020 [Candidatus Nanohaloarchaea archaeon]|nr:hypothetical protein [Candidatus Nanohaloarchaea archaeon]
MDDEMREWIRSRRRDGATDDRIVNELMENGYSQERAQDLVATVAGEDDDGGTGTLSRLSILAVFGMVFFLYLVMGVGTFTGLPGFFALFAGLVFLVSLLVAVAHLGSVVYRLVTGNGPGMVSLVFGLTVIGAAVLGVLLPVRSLTTPSRGVVITVLMLIQGAGMQFGGISILRTVSIVFTVALFALAVEAYVALRSSYNRLSLIIPVVTVIAVAGLYAGHVMTIRQAQSMDEGLSVQHPSLEQLHTLQPSERLARTMTVLPPFGNDAVLMTTVGYASGVYASVQGLLPRSRPLAAPGSRCWGTRKNLEERYGSRPSRVAVAGVAVMHRRLQDSEAAVKRRFREVCASMTGSCPTDDASIDEAYNAYLDDMANNIRVLETALGMRVDTEGLMVTSCDTDIKHSGVRLTGISCGDGLSVELENIGDRPIPSIRQVTVRNASSGELVYALSDQTGERIGLAPGDATTYTQEGGFDAGTIYVVGLRFESHTVSAYCRGGNGFCTGCANRSFGE